MVKRLLLGLIIIASCIALFLFAYNYKSEQEQLHSDYRLTPEEIAMIQDGDVILRHGYGMVSDAIVKVLAEDYDISHCAIVCRDSNSIYAVHSVSQTLSDFDGLQTQTLSQFIFDSQKNSIIVARYKSKDSTAAKRISQRAKTYLKARIPFDHDFSMTDTSTFYCQELLWKIFLNEFNDDLYKDFHNGRYDHLKFSVFYDTTKFSIIINHHLKKK